MTKKEREKMDSRPIPSPERLLSMLKATNRAIKRLLKSKALGLETPPRSNGPLTAAKRNKIIRYYEKEGE